MRQEWVCEWEGLKIRVVNWSRGLRTGEELYVNDIQVDSNNSWIWSRMQAYLAAPISVQGSLRTLEVVIGQAPGKFKPRCRIIMDGQRIGGDLGEAPMAMLPEEWEKTRSKGIVRFLFARGILPMGLPYAAMMTFVFSRSEKPLSIPGAITSFLFMAVAFGGLMGYFFWRSGKKCYESAKSKLEGPPRFTI